jgi:tetratricopeptide (TPR) repeat protein
MPDVPFDPPDLHHLRSAQGWLELGNHLEANADLDRIVVSLQNHPAVLLLRWNVAALAKQWDHCINLAKTLIRLVPDQEQGWINLGNSLYFSGRTQEAYDCVKPVRERFPKSPIVPYNLACYACQMGWMEEAKSWLDKAFALDVDRALKLKALEDPDLEPLWRKLGKT